MRRVLATDEPPPLTRPTIGLERGTAARAATLVREQRLERRRRVQLSAARAAEDPRHEVSSAADRARSRRAASMAAADTNLRPGGGPIAVVVRRLGTDGARRRCGVLAALAWPVRVGDLRVAGRAGDGPGARRPCLRRPTGGRLDHGRPGGRLRRRRRGGHDRWRRHDRRRGRGRGRRRRRRGSGGRSRRGRRHRGRGRLGRGGRLRRGRGRGGSRRGCARLAGPGRDARLRSQIGADGPLGRARGSSGRTGLLRPYRSGRRRRVRELRDRCRGGGGGACDLLCRTEGPGDAERDDGEDEVHRPQRDDEARPLCGGHSISAPLLPRGGRSGPDRSYQGRKGRVRGRR